MKWLHKHEWERTRRQVWMARRLPCIGLSRVLWPRPGKGRGWGGGVVQVSHQLQPWPSFSLCFLSHTLSTPFGHRALPPPPPPSPTAPTHLASHPPPAPLLSTYKSISSPKPPPFLPPSLPPRPLDFLYRPSSSSLRGRKWGGSGKVRGGKTKGRERVRGTRGVWRGEMSVFNQSGARTVISVVRFQHCWSN